MLDLEQDNGVVDCFNTIELSVFNHLFNLFKSITFGKMEVNHRRGFPAHSCTVFGYTNYRVV